MAGISTVLDGKTYRLDVSQEGGASTGACEVVVVVPPLLCVFYVYFGGCLCGSSGKWLVLGLRVCGGALLRRSITSRFSLQGIKVPSRNNGENGNT